MLNKHDQQIVIGAVAAYLDDSPSTQLGNNEDQLWAVAYNDTVSQGHSDEEFLQLLLQRVEGDSHDLSAIMTVWEQATSRLNSCTKRVINGRHKFTETLGFDTTKKTLYRLPVDVFKQLITSGIAASRNAEANSPDSTSRATAQVLVVTAILKRTIETKLSLPFERLRLRMFRSSGSTIANAAYQIYEAVNAGSLGDSDTKAWMKACKKVLQPLRP